MGSWGGVCPVPALIRTPHSSPVSAAGDKSGQGRGGFPHTHSLTSSTPKARQSPSHPAKDTEELFSPATLSSHLMASESSPHLPGVGGPG
jgi:hypothetical protein